MINLGKLLLPIMIDYIPEKGKITFRTPEFLSSNYIENSECSLQLHFLGETVFIDYYCEDDIDLSELLELDTEYIASGDLTKENFETIQARALKLLCRFIDDSQEELLEHFDQI